MTAAHSYWPASGMEQRILCPGSHVLQQDAPDNANGYAAEGTAAHQLLTWAGQQGKNAADFIGRAIELDASGRVMAPGSLGTPTWTYLVDEDMAEHVQVCLDYVREVAGDNLVLWDVKLNYASYLGVPEDEGWGTGDVVIMLPDEIVVVDFKYGMGVEVQAGYDDINGYDETVKCPNPQMACYGLGALNEYRDFGDFRAARLVISQPRITRKPSEYDLHIDLLEEWGYNDARNAVNLCQEAQRTAERRGLEVVLADPHWIAAYLNPGEKQCRFCKAKASCPALRNEVAKTVFNSEPATPGEFAIAIEYPELGPSGSDAASWLSVCLDKVDLIEDWCKSIRTEVERRLLAGEAVPRYKLVPGKKGNRQFRDEAEAETAMKSFRLRTEDMYDFKLISPTTAEKRAKAGIIGPRQWAKLQELIVQKEGKPHVAPDSDPRPALVVTPVADDFADVTTSNPDDFAWVR